jgi:hypothetical protein
VERVFYFGPPRLVRSRREDLPTEGRGLTPRERGERGTSERRDGSAGDVKILQHRGDEALRESIRDPVDALLTRSAYEAAVSENW